MGQIANQPYKNLTGSLSTGFLLTKVKPHLSREQAGQVKVIEYRLAENEISSIKFGNLGVDNRDGIFGSKVNDCIVALLTKGQIVK